MTPTSKWEDRKGTRMFARRRERRGWNEHSLTQSKHWSEKAKKGGGTQGGVGLREVVGRREVGRERDVTEDGT